MANIKFNRSIFEKEIGKLNAEMQNKIAMFGTTLEKIDNESLEIEVFPNRPDLLSYQGFKRAFLAFLGKKTGLKEYKVYPPKKDYQVIVESSVKKIRPFTACAVVEDLIFDSEKIKELVDLQEKLHNTFGRKRKKFAVGIYPLEKICFPITYKALEPDKIKFIPLGFNKEMSGIEILQKHEKGKEYTHLLAGKIKFPIFIDGNKDILSMPPIINSQLTGKITEETKGVFVECSGFEPKVLKKCLNIIVTTLAEIGGKIYQMKVKYWKKEITPNLEPQKMKISLEEVNKILGIKINENHLKNFLERMGHNYKKGIVEIPSWRTDILHEIDLIEDVAIAYGYENFVLELPEISTIGEEQHREIIKRKIREALIGLKMLEVSNFHLTKKTEQFSKMGCEKEQGFVELESSKTDYTILRKDLTHYLLNVLSENVDAEHPQEIFEIGKVFSNEKKICETENLAVALSPGNFTMVKQILEYFSEIIGFSLRVEEVEKSPQHFINGRVAKIIFKDETIGYLGEIHPKILKYWKIKMPIAVFEINLEGVFKEFETP